MGRKYAKLSIGADVILQQIICTIKIRRAPTRHDNMHRFQINYNKDIRYPSSHYLSIVTADKGYDSEDNHLLVREQQHAFSVIPARYEHVPIWRAHGKYREQMKRGYSKLLYNQRNKDDETIISVIKRLFGEYIKSSRLVRTQNRELSFRCIAYNTYRLTNLTRITWFLQSQLVDNSALLHDSKIRLSNIVLGSTITSSRHGNTLFRSRFKIKLTNIRFMQQSR